MHGAPTVKATGGASRVVTTTTVVPVAARRLLVPSGRKANKVWAEPDDLDDYVRVERPLRVATAHPSFRLHNGGRSQRFKAVSAGRAALAEYARCLIDPFDSWQTPARIPQRAAAPTSVFSVRQAYTVHGTANGDGTYVCSALLSGGLSRFFAASGWTNTFAQRFPHQYVSQWDNGGNEIAHGYWPLLDTTIPKYPGEPETLETWDSVPTLGAIVDSYTSYRPVCKGMRITYVGPKLTAAGVIAVGLLPGDRRPAGRVAAGNPFMMGGGNGGDFSLTFESAAALLGAEVYDATLGATVVWTPASDDIDEWRPINYVPPQILNLGTTLSSSVTGIMGAVNTAYCVPCDGDASEFKAMADNFASPAFASYVNSLAPVPLGSMTDILALTNRVNTTLSGIQSASDPMLVMCAKNLSADAAFEVEVIVTYEAIADTRAFSAVMPNRVVAPARELAMVRSIAASLPASSPGNSRNYLSRIASGVSTAVSLGRHLVEGVQQALPVAGNVMRALGLGTEAGLVEGISEGGPALIDSLAPLAIAAV